MLGLNPKCPAQAHMPGYCPPASNRLRLEGRDVTDLAVTMEVVAPMHELPHPFCGGITDGPGKRIEPHVPVWDKTERKDGTFSSSDFAWDEQANEYCCPEGHALRSDSRAFKNPRTRITKADTIIYRSSQFDRTPVRRKTNAVLTRQPVKFLAVSMRPSGMWLGP